MNAGFHSESSGSGKGVMETGLRVATMDDWGWLQVRLLWFRGHVVKPGSSQHSQIHHSSKVHLRPCLLLLSDRLTRGWGWGCDGHGRHCWLWHADSRANHLCVCACVCVCESELMIVVPLLSQWSLYVLGWDQRMEEYNAQEAVVNFSKTWCLQLIFLCACEFYFFIFGLFIYFFLLLFCFG